MIFSEDKDDWTESYMYVHVKEVFKKHIIKREQEQQRNRYVNR